eukprot:COSAG01_NODE_6695_length_3539_cov_7.099419_1_plen_304_part_00
MTTTQAHCAWPPRPPPAQRDRKQDAAPRHNHNSSVAVWVLGAALLAQGATSALLWTLWPLWLRLHFRTGDIGFAPLLFLASVAAIAALAAAPAWRATTGSARRAAALSCFAAGVLAPLAFAMQCSGGFTAHVALLLGCVLSLTMLEASLKVYVSEIAPRSWQGSALGVAASCVGVGALLANIVGTLLYEASIPTGIGAEDNLRTWPPILPRSSILDMFVWLAFSILTGRLIVEPQQLTPACAGARVGGQAMVNAQGALCGAGSSWLAWGAWFESLAMGGGGLLPFTLAGMLLTISAAGLLVFQ